MAIKQGRTAYLVRSPWRGLCVLVLLASAACSGLTDVEAPDVVQPDQVSNAQGAEAYTAAALASLYRAYPTFVYNSGLLSDELQFATPLTSFADIDYRQQSLTFTQYAPVAMHQTRTLANLAIDARHDFAPTPRARLGQLFAFRGYVEMVLGETTCNGTPLSEVVNFEPVYGGPITSDSVLKRALVSLDSATVYAQDSARILNLVRVARGRTLINLGRFADAANAVAAVPTGYVYNAEMTTAVPGQSNTIWQNNNTGTITVSDREGTNGLDFHSADDPRVPTESRGTGTDGITPVYFFSGFGGLDAPIAMASGIEARLIQAEAALQANPDDTSPTGTGWLGILNDLRANQLTPGLSPLADPGSFNARVDMLFRERAFWLYATGHRLGDMRRLLRQYNRSQSDLYPVGPYKGGQSYGTDVVFIMTSSEQSNPNGRECMNVNP